MKKNPYGRILKWEPKEQHLITVPKSFSFLFYFFPSPSSSLSSSIVFFFFFLFIYLNLLLLLLQHSSIHFMLQRYGHKMVYVPNICNICNIC